MPDVFVRLLVYWYRTQNTCVRWGTACSEMFTVSNGVRQGGILSPLFFNVYMDGLSEILCRTECGCTMGGRMINHLMYADDLVILSPSAKGLQRLVDIMLPMAIYMTLNLITPRLRVCICHRKATVHLTLHTFL